MKKFMLLAVGYREMDKETGEAWMKWFGSLEKYVVDQGAPFTAGTEITPNGKADLPVSQGSITGYTIIKAESMAEAVKLAEAAPIIEAMRVYELMPVEM